MLNCKNLITIALGLAVADVAGAGEPIRFGKGTSFEGGLATRPQRSLQDTMTVAGHSEAFGSVNQAAPASGATPAVRIVRPVSEDQRNWIFRDARSAEGIQRALGVEGSTENVSSDPAPDSTAVIQQYFERQQMRPEGAGVGTGLGSALGQGGGVSQPGHVAGGTPGQVLPVGPRSGQIFGEDTFKATLNSGNHSVRQYFRNVYYPQEGLTPVQTPSRSPLYLPTDTLKLNSPGGLPSASAEQDNSVADLAAKASLIQSLTPVSPSFGTPTTTPAPTRQPSSVKTVNDGTLIERRNGLTEIPSRRF